MTDKATSDKHAAAVAISVRNLSKSYRLFSHPGDRIKQFFSLGLRQYHHEFAALNDVSFDIKRGETIGIIGRNGSGKSTLLQVICGILKPTSGTVQVNGRVSALLELGAGFNPEFTGRENVFFQGAILGLGIEEMNAQFAAIAAFSDIGEFIDQPVRTYSSGMFVRLAFSVAIHVSPEILVIDEALAVGDQVFQRRCIDYLDRLRQDGHTTIIFVSHNIRQVERLCARALLLDQGRMIALEDANAACNRYYKLTEQLPVFDAANAPRKSFRPEQCLGGVVLEAIAVGGGDESIAMHAPLVIDLTLRLSMAMQGIEVIVGIHTPDMVYISLASSAQSVNCTMLAEGQYRISAILQDNMLRPGPYWIGIGIYDHAGRQLWREDNVHPFIVTIGQTDVTRMPTTGILDLPFNWHVTRMADSSQSF